MIVKKGKGSTRVYPESERAQEKAQQRLRDEERLRRGEVTPQQLAKENDWLFGNLPIERFEIVRIGGKPVGQRRRVPDDEPR